MKEYHKDKLYLFGDNRREIMKNLKVFVRGRKR